MSHGRMLKPRKGLHHRRGKRKGPPEVVRRVLVVLLVVRLGVLDGPPKEKWLYMVQPGQIVGEREGWQNLYWQRNINGIGKCQ